jgi:hypothetical protein
MAARKTPSRGGKPDKLMRDALLLELNTEAKRAGGKPTKRLRLVARKLVERATLVMPARRKSLLPDRDEVPNR